MSNSDIIFEGPLKRTVNILSEERYYQLTSTALIEFLKKPVSSEEQKRCSQDEEWLLNSIGVIALLPTSNSTFFKGSETGSSKFNIYLKSGIEILLMAPDEFKAQTWIQKLKDTQQKLDKDEQEISIRNSVSSLILDDDFDQILEDCLDPELAGRITHDLRKKYSSDLDTSPNLSLVDQKQINISLINVPSKTKKVPRKKPSRLSFTKNYLPYSRSKKKSSRSRSVTDRRRNQVFRHRSKSADFRGSLDHILQEDQDSKLARRIKHDRQEKYSLDLDPSLNLSSVDQRKIKRSQHSFTKNHLQIPRKKTISRYDNIECSDRLRSKQRSISADQNQTYNSGNTILVDHSDFSKSTDDNDRGSLSRSRSILDGKKKENQEYIKKCQELEKQLQQKSQEMEEMKIRLNELNEDALLSRQISLIQNEYDLELQKIIEKDMKGVIATSLALKKQADIQKQNILTIENKRAEIYEKEHKLFLKDRRIDDDAEVLNEKILAYNIQAKAMNTQAIAVRKVKMENKQQKKELLYIQKTRSDKAAGTTIASTTKTKAATTMVMTTTTTTTTTTSTTATIITATTTG